MAANGQLVFTDVDKVTFKGVGDTSNAVIDTTTGKIGVGVDSPDANLHVLGNCFVSTNFELGGTMTMGTVTVRAQHELSAITATGNTTPHTVEFTNAETGLVTTGNVSVGKELTVAGNVAVDTDTLFVDTVNSRVGVGTTSPDNALHIRNAIPAVLLDDSDDDTKVRITGGAGGDLYVDSNWGGSGNTGDIIFREASSEKMRIAGNGNVGIGTANPQYRLDVGDGGGDVMLRVMHQTASSGKLIFGRSGTTDIRSHAIESYNSSGSQNNYMKFLVHDGTGTSPYETRTEVMTLLGNGNVGIGTTDPAKKLHVEHYGSAIGDFEGIRIANHATNLHATSRPAYEFVVSDINAGTGLGNGKFAIGYRGSTTASRTDRLVIDNSGNVGIGTTSPIAALDIDGGPENDTVPAFSIRGGLYSESDLYVLNTYNDSTVGGVGYAAKVIGVNIKNKVETNNTVQIRSNSGGLTCGSAMYLGSDDAISGVFGILTGDGAVGTTLTEKLTVRASGNVGIGDSDPDSILHVQSDAQSATGGPIKKTSATAATSGFNYILNAPRPGTTSQGAVFFINGSTRTNDGDTNNLTIRNDSGSVDIGNRTETLVSSHTPTPETYNANQKNVDILLNNGSIWMSPYTGRHRSLGTSTNTWSQYIGKHYLGRILSGLEIENKNTNSAGATSYYSNLLHFRAHDYGIYGGSVGDITMTVRGDKVGIRTETPGYTLHVNGSLFYSSGGLNGSDDRIKYNEENITNALDIIDKLTPQKYEKIMTFPSNAKGTWIPTDENWETVKNAEMKPWEGFKYGNEFGFIAQDVRNIPEVSFLVSGSESITGDENISPEEYNELNDEERSSYTQKFIYESNVITLQEYTSLTLENRENYTELYSKRVETQTPLGLNYQGIFVVAVKAIQELKSENETLKTQLTSVLARLDALENA